MRKPIIIGNWKMQLLESGAEKLISAIANDLNNKGQVVGYGTIDGETHAFLASPVSIPVAAWLLLTLE